MKSFSECGAIVIEKAEENVSEMMSSIENLAPERVHF
jgi:hypothetical protein